MPGSTSPEWAIFIHDCRQGREALQTLGWRQLPDQKKSVLLFEEGSLLMKRHVEQPDRVVADSYGINDQEAGIACAQSAGPYCRVRESIGGLDLTPLGQVNLSMDGRDPIWQELISIGEASVAGIVPTLGRSLDGCMPLREIGTPRPTRISLVVGRNNKGGTR